MELIQPEKEENRLTELIALVNDKFINNPWDIVSSKIFLKRNWAQITSFSFFMVMFIFLSYLLYIISQAVTQSLSQLKIESVLALLLALIASLIAISNFSINLINFGKSEKAYLSLVDYNYEKMKICSRNDGELALLKALVILKSKRPEINLKLLLQNPEKILTREKIFEILYNSD